MATNNAINVPTEATGKTLISQGVGVAPVFGVADVTGGGTGKATLTNHALLVGQGTSAVASATIGAAGTVLQSGGASVDPSFSTATYPSTASVNGSILRSNGTNWVNTNATYPNNIAIGEVLYGSASNVISALANGTTGQVFTANTGAAPSWANPSPDTITWTDVTGTSQAMVVNSGYLANNGSLVTLTLPATAAQFSVIKVTGVGAGGWKIAQNANQKILWLGVSSTVGVTGFLSSVEANACVTIRAYVGGASTFWIVESSEGNLTIS